MQKKIIIIGDSLALPNHKVTYEDTWVKKLKNKFQNYDFIYYLKRGITTNVLTTLGVGKDGTKDKYPFGSDCLEYYNPNLVIVQLGIVDCAPRLFNPSSLESKIIRRLPALIRKIYINLIKKIRRPKSSLSYVSSKKFTFNISNYLERCKKNAVDKIILIGIPLPDSRMIESNRDIVKNVKKYNSILEDIAKTYNNVSIIYPLDTTSYDFEITYDGYHPNEKGHDMIFNQLNSFLYEQ